MNGSAGIVARRLALLAVAVFLAAMVFGCAPVTRQRESSPIAQVQVDNETPERVTIWLVRSTMRVRRLGDVNPGGRVALLLFTRDVEPGANIALVARGIYETHHSQVFMVTPGDVVIWTVQRNANFLTRRYAE